MQDSRYAESSARRFTTRAGSGPRRSCPGRSENSHERCSHVGRHQAPGGFDRIRLAGVVADAELTGLNAAPSTPEAEVPDAPRARAKVCAFKLRSTPHEICPSWP